MTHLYPGLFITFEGIDGAGKSTHINYVCELLQNKFPLRKIIRTREPGGTTLGENLREILLNESMDIETEALLMFAARNEHIKKVIEPALQDNSIVISDRFTDASYAYQVGGRGLPREKMDKLELWVQSREYEGRTHLIQPNITFLFDLPPEVAQERRAAVRNPDKFESLNLHFFESVRNEYLRRAKEMPNRFLILNSLMSIDEIQNQLRSYISSL